MENWIELLLNPQAINGIYLNDVPSLEPILLHEIRLQTQGSDVVLRFDLPMYPNIPPKKWQAQGFNSVQVELGLIGIRKFSIDGWDECTRMSLEISRRENGIYVGGENDSIRFGALVDFVRAEKISGYLNGR